MTAEGKRAHARPGLLAAVSARMLLALTTGTPGSYSPARGG